VIYAVADPLVACGESQRETRMVMPAQCALHRHQTVSDGCDHANLFQRQTCAKGKLRARRVASKVALRESLGS
jgi:hypothetical protein